MLTRDRLGTDGSNALDERRPPQNLEAERSVLGGCLLDETVIDDVISILTPGDFYFDAHAVLFGLIVDLRGRGLQVDCVTLADELERAGKMAQVGGDEGLAEIANSVPHAANARYHAEIVRQKATMRRLIQAAAEILQDGYSNLMTAPEAVAAAESKVFAVRESEVVGTSIPVGSLVGDALDAVARRAEKGPGGLVTGFRDLDAVLGGFKPEELTIVGARPSQGKTAFGLQIAGAAALEYRAPVLFASLEMGRHSLMSRLLSCEGRIDSRKIERNRGAYRLDDDETARLYQAAHRLADAPITIDDSPSQTVGRIAANARRMKRRQGLGLVLVDYLSLIDGERQKGESRQEEVAKISRRLKASARETGVPWVVLHQLNRENEKRGDKRPCMADLRESGQIEQDADVILLLHRPAYYDPNDKPGIAEINVAKNRNGPTEPVEVAWVNWCTRFENIEPNYGRGGF